jgi:hypothetical protein
MKNLIKTMRKTHLLCLFMILGLTSTGAAQFSSNYTGKATVNKTDVVELKVTHASDVIVNTTESNEVSFTVSVNIDADDEVETEVNELLKGISYEIEQKPGKLVLDLKSPFKNFRQTDWWFFGVSTKIELVDGREFVFEGKVNFDMVIHVNMPQGNDLQVDGAFSTIDLGYLDGSIDLDISHSTLKGNDLGPLNINAQFSKINVGNVLGDSKIKLSHSKMSSLQMKDVSTKLSFSTLEINGVKNLKSEKLEHSKLVLETAEEIDIEKSYFSTLDVHEAKDIRLGVYQHGKILVDDAAKFDLKDGAFAKMSIGTIHHHIYVNAAHSNMEVKHISKEVASIEIKNQFATVDINTEAISDFDLYVTNGRFTKVKNRGDGIEKKADGYFKKRLTSNSVINIDINCPHCTVNIN